MELLELGKDAYTYIAEVGGEDRGRVIDHALSEAAMRSPQ